MEEEWGELRVGGVEYMHSQDLKVLTHEFEAESVLLKFLRITKGYPKTQKNGPRPPVGLT